MDESEILDKISKVFLQHGYDEVTLDTPFVGAPITKTGIIMAIEEEFGEGEDDPDLPGSGRFLNPLELPDQEVMKAETVEDLVRLVKETLDKKINN